VAQRDCRLARWQTGLGCTAARWGYPHWRWKRCFPERWRKRLKQRPPSPACHPPSCLLLRWPTPLWGKRLWPSTEPRTSFGRPENQPGASSRDRPQLPGGGSAPSAGNRLPRRSSARPGKWGTKGWQAWLVQWPWRAAAWAAPSYDPTASWGEANKRPRHRSIENLMSSPPAVLSQHSTELRHDDRPPLGWLIAPWCCSGSPCGSMLFCRRGDDIRTCRAREIPCGPARRACSARRTLCWSREPAASVSPSYSAPTTGPRFSSRLLYRGKTLCCAACEPDKAPPSVARWRV